jgi:uncharacterized protein with gpF-like domain
VRNKLQAWLRQHGAGERSFSRALERYFRAQTARIASAWENFPGASPENLAAVFQPEAEHEILRPILRRNLGALMVQGARAELAAHEARTAKSESGEEYEDFYNQQLPAVTRDGIRAALDDLERQDYWQAIQSETASNLRQIIEQAIDDKRSNNATAELIRAEMSGLARKRARKIARTETTGAMNAGHLAAMQDLGDGGAILGKEWVAIGDRDVRQTHADASGQRVPVRAPFRIGGYDAPHPGHWSLPARERIHCRCLVLSVFDPSVTED